MTGGENVYPAEVENVLMKHPAVGDVAVIGVPDERVGRGGEGRSSSSPRAQTCPRQELITFAREHLAGYKLPKSVDFADGAAAKPVGQAAQARAPRARTGRVSSAASADAAQGRNAVRAAAMPAPAPFQKP